MEASYVHFKMSKTNQEAIKALAIAKGQDKWKVIDNLIEGGLQMAKSAKKATKKVTKKATAKKK